MADRHLNLFYSYNLSEDAELIEDNLTRAFIQTLRILSRKNRQNFLRKLLKNLTEYDYANAEFALQGNIEPNILETCPNKYLVTIATNPPKEEKKKAKAINVKGGSLPDAWIYKEQSYCFLIECKRGGSPVIEEQIIKHAKNYFGFNDNELKEKRLDLTWGEVVWVIEKFVSDFPQERIYSANEQERYVLEHFRDFLDSYGYRIFKGFDFEKIPECPDWQLYNNTHDFTGIEFENIPDVPDWQLYNAPAFAGIDFKNIPTIPTPLEFSLGIKEER
uniref:Uncharacterized protein n=1 Tax=candidate division WOR-3 bacterium TaxID=2052148 RepID=A0A7C1NDH2_UNCW3